MNNNMEESKGLPYVRIVEQPASRTRYRYACENKMLGNLMGVNSGFPKKTYPAIEIVNSDAPALVVISCVTRTQPYRPHPHHIFGKSKEISQGILCRKLPANHSIVSFRNLGIQCVKRKDMSKSLSLREQLKIDPFKTGFGHKAKTDVLDMGCVRLCIQVFLESKVNGMFKIPLAPVVTNPIYDKKTSSSLVVWWLSHCSAPVTGGTVICLLCEKLSKWDLEIRFFCEKTGWETLAELEPPEFHRQVAVIFKAPKYVDQYIEEPVEVKLEIKQPSNGETSEAIPFLYVPVEYESENGFKIKRQKCGDTPKGLVSRHLINESQKYVKKPNERDTRVQQNQSRDETLINLSPEPMKKSPSTVQPVTRDAHIILDSKPTEKSLPLTKPVSTKRPSRAPPNTNSRTDVIDQVHFNQSYQQPVPLSYQNFIMKPSNQPTNNMGFDIRKSNERDMHILQNQSRNQTLMTLAPEPIKNSPPMIEPITRDARIMLDYESRSIDKSHTLAKQVTENRSSRGPTMNSRTGVMEQLHFNHSYQQPVPTSYYNSIMRPPNQHVNGVSYERFPQHVPRTENSTNRCLSENFYQ